MFFSGKNSEMPDKSEMAKHAREAIKQAFTTTSGIEQLVKNAVTLCWMIQPQEHRTTTHVEAVMRQVVEGILADLKRDPKKFGVLDLPPCPDPKLDFLQDTDGD